MHARSDGIWGPKGGAATRTEDLSMHVLPASISGLKATAATRTELQKAAPRIGTRLPSFLSPRSASSTSRPAPTLRPLGRAPGTGLHAPFATLETTRWTERPGGELPFAIGPPCDARAV